MLFRINLNDKKMYDKLIKQQLLELDNGFYENLMDGWNVLNEEEIKTNIDFITTIKVGDFIWIKYYDDVLIAKVIDKSFILEDAFVLPVEVHEYKNKIPQKVRRSLKKMDIENIDDKDSFLETQEIFEQLSAKNLNDIKIQINHSNEIELRKKAELINVETKKIEIKKNPSQNFGELIIEVHPPEKNESSVPAISKKSKELAKKTDYDDFYMELLKDQLAFYEDMQKLSREHFIKMQKNFFERINNKEHK